jgi:hypothetical protein
MSKLEVKKLFEFRKGRYLPCGLNIREKLWWRFMPGVVINVAWPKGQVRVGPSHSLGWNGIGDYFEYVESADPNDHYRPWMEEHVGQQGWDWNWGMADRDATDNRLTIKIRQKYAKYATIAVIKWA